MGSTDTIVIAGTTCTIASVKVDVDVTHTFINDLAVGYTWGPVSVNLSFAIYSIKYYRQDLGEDPEGLEVRPHDR